MINSLKLTNFRQFKKKEFKFDSNIVIILGNNTKGKSTILESIYYLTNGSSPWAENGDIISHDNEYFRVDAQLDDGEGEPDTYSVYKDHSKRNLQIGMKNTTSKRFFRKISSTLFSPELIEILLISPSKRREFLDTFCSVIDDEYKEELDKYKKILRQRNGYVRKLSKNFYETGFIPNEDKQLEYWTHLLTESSARIMQKRLEYIGEVNEIGYQLSYKSTVDFHDLEDILSLEDLLEMTEYAMLNSKKRDIAVGHTNVGIHRDDWSIIDGKDIKRFGSRGEKRIAIIKLIYLTHNVIAKKKGYAPYLLLDDIPSELDDENIKKIFNKETLGKQQTFITAIRKNDIPKEILKGAMILELAS
ncbi:DNA replication/repair protein RecF [Candidatus Dojkabacteria bacterium]|nr:DNA replication/repair protein RecF [Candidatus Dojkabacteria bacterium]